MSPLVYYSSSSNIQPVYMLIICKDTFSPIDKHVIYTQMQTHQFIAKSKKIKAKVYLYYILKSSLLS